jgi:ankyrin repeat protein
MATHADLLEAFEVHSPSDIRRILAAGISPIEPIKGSRPIDHLIEAYLRSSRFPDCLRVMLDAGATIDDPVLEAILLDDDVALRPHLQNALLRQLDLLAAFTSCRGVSPLHVCAEFNSVRCARALLDAGADVNARAAIDTDGFGGHTPIFHTVSSILNYCRPMMELLVERGADLDVRVNMILWGESMDWETIVFDQTPISYAQCGLYRQFHRKEEDVYDNLDYLYRARHGSAPPRRNVPNRYLKS